MPAPLRFPVAPAEDIPEEILHLGRCLDELPPSQGAQLKEAFSQVVECVRRRRRILNLVQEALSQLRLDIKYLMFDLEITRQEREELRMQLDNMEQDDFGSSW